MSIRRSVVAVALAAAACTSVQPVQPAQFIPQHTPTVVSVWTAGHKDATVVENPAIRGDTLTGLVFGRPWAMPLDDIALVKADAHNPKRTVLLVAGVAVAVGGLAALLSGSTKIVGRPACPDSDSFSC